MYATKCSCIKKLDAKTLPEAIKLFLSDGDRVRIEVIPALIERLQKLKDTISCSLGWRFYSSSLLLLYEGDSECLSCRDLILSVGAPDSTCSNPLRVNSNMYIYIYI